MSEQKLRSLSGPVQVVDPPKTFAQQLAEAGFPVPDQYEMARIRLAVRLKMPMDTPERDLRRLESVCPGAEPFQVFTLREYAQVPENVTGAFHNMGAPMPPMVADHVAGVRENFPDAEVRVHAHRAEDPQVEFILNGESIFTIGWIWPASGGPPQTYPER